MALASLSRSIAFALKQPTERARLAGRGLPSVPGRAIAPSCRNANAMGRRSHGIDLAVPVIETGPGSATPRVFPTETISPRGNHGRDSTAQG